MSMQRTITAVPYDVPVVGYHNQDGEYVKAYGMQNRLRFQCIKNVLKYKRETEMVSEFLYPDDTHDEGKILRLKQQYFLVSASMSSIVRSYLQNHEDLRDFHHHVCIHINDTHPVLAIPELMRILIDDGGIGLG